PVVVGVDVVGVAPSVIDVLRPRFYGVGSALCAWNVVLFQRQVNTRAEPQRGSVVVLTLQAVNVVTLPLPLALFALLAFRGSENGFHWHCWPPRLGLRELSFPCR